MLRLIKWLFLALVVMGALVVALLLSKDAVARTAVEQQLRAQTGMEVKIKKLSLKVFWPTATLEDVTLYNPADFGGIPFLRIREMQVEYDPEALAHREVKLKLMKLDVTELAVVRNDRDQTNIIALATGAKPARRSEWFDFKAIDVLNLSIQRVNFVDLQNQRQQRQFNWNERNQIFRDIKSSDEFYRAFVTLWNRHQTP